MLRPRLPLDLALAAAVAVGVSGCTAQEGSGEAGPGGKSDDLGNSSAECQRFLDCLHRGAPAATCAPQSNEPLCETAEERGERHLQVDQIRRRDKLVMVHRGSWDFGHENSLEAFRATMELGAAGNEIDIRRTEDGVLVLFHDDTIDRALLGVGTIRDSSWSELAEIPFRDPGSHGEFTRIATLAQTLLLHREAPGLIHLDIKEPGIDGEIAALLTALDMWDHVIFANDANAGSVLADSRYRPRSRMVGLSVGRGDLDPDLVADAVRRAQDGVFVDDPRAALLALGRELGPVSSDPVFPAPWSTEIPLSGRAEPELRAVIEAADGWNELPSDEARSAELAREISARARAAIELAAHVPLEAETQAALERRVRERGMHRDWQYHGLDGSEALFTLARARAPSTVELAREMVFLDDPALQPIAFEGFPAATVDWRMKSSLWDALELLGPDPSAATLCRDYLALGDSEAEAIGPLNFEAAAETLLRVEPGLENGLFVLQHRRSDVRARGILEMLRRLDESWAAEAIDQAAPFARDYAVTNR